MTRVVAKKIRFTPACFHFLYFKLNKGEMLSSDQLNKRQTIIQINFCHEGICSKKVKNNSMKGRLGSYKYNRIYEKLLKVR